MIFNKIVCLDFTGQEFDASVWKLIDQYAKKRAFVKSSDPYAATVDSGVDALLVKLGAKVDKDVIDLFPYLKYIGMLGTGYGGIDIRYARKLGITVTNIANYSTEAVAEFTLAILLEQLRSIAQARNQAVSGDYSDNFNGQEISGKKFGVIGLGNIGNRTTQLARAFGADTYYWSRHRRINVESTGIKYRELKRLMSSSDIITLNLALTDGTQGIISSELISRIKPNAIFINVSPMELIDFTALVKRLQKKDMVFILDHSDEMTAAQLRVLSKLDNCIIYPPIGYLTEEASVLKKQIYLDNIKNYLTGKPSNRVN